MRDRYSLLVGLLFLALVVIATLNTLGGGGGDDARPRPRAAARPLPEFAVPAAAGELEGDANVAQDDCETLRRSLSRGRPAAPPPAGSRPPGALRVCDFFDRPLVLSFWFTKGGDCTDQQDIVDCRRPSATVDG